jgi:hypothetical protein
LIQFPELLALRQASFGKRTAEEEREHLAQYFVETEYWRSVFDGETDIVYGAKGSGKSAIYSLLLNNEGPLFDRKILVAPAENPQGAPAFAIFGEKRRGEVNLVYLWKLYILSICANQMRQYDLLSKPNGKKFIGILQDADLVPVEFNLVRALRRAFDYIKSGSSLIHVGKARSSLPAIR